MCPCSNKYRCAMNACNIDRNAKCLFLNENNNCGLWALGYQVCSYKCNRLKYFPSCVLLSDGRNDAIKKVGPH